MYYLAANLNVALKRACCYRKIIRSPRLLYYDPRFFITNKSITSRKTVVPFGTPRINAKTNERLHSEYCIYGDLFIAYSYTSDFTSWYRHTGMNGYLETEGPVTTHKTDTQVTLTVCADQASVMAVLPEIISK